MKKIFRSQDSSLLILLAVLMPSLSQQAAGSPLQAELPIKSSHGKTPATPVQSGEHSESFYKDLAQRIWRNESGCSVKKLVWWNEGESFMSLGIGHFLWFCKNCNASFTQTFPQLLDFMKLNGKKIPAWLEATKQECPWTDRKQVVDSTDYRLQELRSFLHETTTLQARFMVNRFEKSFIAIVQMIPCNKRSVFNKRINILAKTPQGLYALIDYVNFKGDGTNKKERYHKRGWGLLQVIEQMDSAAFENNPQAAFVASAKKLLIERVENAPPEKNENRWLCGWINRLHTYL